MDLRGLIGRHAKLAVVGAVVGLLAFMAALAPSATHAQNTDPGKPSPEQCATRCAERGRAEYDRCVAAGRPEERCAAAAREAVQKCREGCRGTVKPPATDNACAKDCATKARQGFQDCVKGGGDEAKCKEAAVAQLKSCTDACPKPEPPANGDGCAKDCALKARQGYKECVDGGGDEATCKEAAVAQLKACTDACPKPERAPKPSCDALCDRAAQHVEKSCLEAGGTVERCSAAAADARAKCADRCARGGTEPKPGRPQHPAPGPGRPGQG